MILTLSPKNIVGSGLCIGCGCCAAQASLSGMDARMVSDIFGNLRPEKRNEWYSKPSGNFSLTCPFSPFAKNEDELSEMLFKDAVKSNSSIGRYISNYAGYVREDDFRTNGSSGGMVTWIAVQLLRKGLISGVAHVIPVDEPQKEGRFFKFRLSKNEKEIREGAKSRYYPVEMSEILNEITETPGSYAVVAVPCMIKAINLLRQQYPVFRDRIRYTLGLFCGHMKSTRFVESLAWQMKVPVMEIKQADFRYKYPGRPANWYNAMLRLNNGHEVHKDWWHLADGDWGAGFFMNPACNFCDDVVAETADISFGDAWIEPYTSDGRGTNVVIVRSSAIREMISAGIDDGRVHLEEVDAGFVAQTQAAGLRHRREGLAYRLAWAKPRISLAKRVAPDSKGLTKERKRIYRMRYWISKWSHHMFRIAKVTGLHSFYLIWARTALSVYHGVAYHRGKFGEISKRFIQLSKK